MKMALAASTVASNINATRAPVSAAWRTSRLMTTRAS